MSHKSSIVTFGAAALALGAVAVSTAPAAAGTITFDASATIDGNVSIDPGAIALIDSLGLVSSLNSSGLLPNGVVLDPITSGNFPINESITRSFTIDDDPQQYLDGDISLGVDLLYSVFGINVDPSEIAYIDDLFDLDISGGGILTNGTESLDFILSYDSNDNEIRATFANFNPQNNFISSCLIGTCTTTGNFAFSLISTFAPFLGLSPTIASGNGNFLVTTTPQGNGSPDPTPPVEEPTPPVEEPTPPVEEPTPPVEEPTPPVEEPTPPVDNPVQSVPEPTMLIGLLGVGGFLATRRGRSRAA
jgi:hypothetical protein